jgi:galactose-1-phosphate uridylyltransferase
MTQQLDRATLATILQARNVEDLSAADLVRLFREEAGMARCLPDGLYQVDPRNGDRILYTSSRGRRPHDNQPPSTAPAKAPDCVICQGRTTGVVDVADLSEGFTFINKNLFPVLYPLEWHHPDGGRERDPASGPAAFGFHFLQWTSSLHDRDWHNMPLADLTVVMGRLAALEKSLLAASADLLPGAEPDGRGFVSVVKNYGRLVGGSLAHGHQQIAFSNVMPRRVWDNRRFEAGRGQTFSAYLLHRNPAELTIVDYGPAALLVPYFMRRPYDMILLVRDATKGHLCELTADEIAAVARGWHDATRAIHTLMPAMGREVAYNVITNNGPGTGIYFEFLPYTQEDGGLEKLGLLVCQGRPEMAAASLRELLGEL